MWQIRTFSEVKTVVIALSRWRLVRVLRDVTDPGDWRGVRYGLFTVLSLAVTGVLAGWWGLTAILGSALAGLTRSDLGVLGLGVGRVLLSESTIRRVVQDLDAVGLDAFLVSWCCTRTGTIEGRTVVVVDSRTMPGARGGEGPAHSNHQTTDPTNHLNPLYLY